MGCISGSPGCTFEEDDDGGEVRLLTLIKLQKSHLCPEPYYLMAIGGEGNSMVEVASLNPASDPLPACLEYLNPLPDSLYGAAGGLDNDGLHTKNLYCNS